MTDRTTQGGAETLEGRCLCGAVRVTLTGRPTEMQVCHCDDCRRAAGGGPLFGVVAKGADVVWRGEDRIGVHRSSPWAERGFCRDCGARLFFRMAGAAATGNLSLSPALFDGLDPPVSAEMFVDRQPACYAIPGDHPRVTGAEGLTELDAFLAGRGLRRDSLPD